MIALIALCVSGALSPPDQVPLRFPKLSRPLTRRPVVVTRSTPTADPSLLDKATYIGAGLSGTVVSGRLRAGGGAQIHAGYRLPALGRRLGFEIAVGFAGLLGNSNALSAGGFWLSFPLGLTYHDTLVGPGLIKASVAVSFDYLSVSADSAAALRSDQQWTIGAVIGAGYLLPIGPGTLLFELKYRLLPYVADNQREVAHGAIVVAGYNFHLW